MSTITFQAASPYFRPSPRGARWAAQAFLRLLSVFESRRETAVAPQLSRAEEAASVRAMARSVEATEPGFAADLYAAADRHENLAG